MDKLDIRFDWQHGALKGLDAAPARIKLAMKNAITSVTQWARVQVRREVSKATGVQLRVIQGRMHITVRDNFGWIWVGLNPISVRRLDPKVVSGGVQAAGRFFPDAFIVGGDGPLAGQVMVRKGAARLPIQKQTVDIQKEGEAAVRRISEQVNTRLYTEFSRQMERIAA
jgi:hypothetical protein